MAFNLLPLAFRYFNTIISPRVSFLFFLVLFCLLKAKGQGAPIASLIPVLFIHTCMTLLREGACTSSCLMTRITGSLVVCQMPLDLRMIVYITRDTS